MSKRIDGYDLYRMKKAYDLESSRDDVLRAERRHDERERRLRESHYEAHRFDYISGINPPRFVAVLALIINKLSELFIILFLLSGLIMFLLGEI